MPPRKKRNKMMLYSCKALYFAVVTTFAYVGIFVYWQGYTQHLVRTHYNFHEGQNSTTKFVRSGAQIPNQTQPELHKQDANNDNNNTWNDENKLDLIYKALTKYYRKSMNEIDIIHGLGIGAVLEMEDPMGGRNFGCLAIYFHNWTFTTKEDMPRFPVFESFFEWLDYGEGRDLELVDDDSDDDDNNHTHCPKSHFDLKRHRKFTATERAETEIEFDIDEKNGHRIVNVSFALSHAPLYNGEWLMAWGVDRKIYLLDEKWGGEENDDDDAEKIHFGHATFFCGRPLLFAGSLFVVNGTIAWINKSSGHYKPTLPYMRNFYEFLRDEKGVNVSTIEWREHQDESLDSNWVETAGKNASYGIYARDY